MRVTITVHGLDPVTIDVPEGQALDDIVTIDLNGDAAVSVAAVAIGNPHLELFVDEYGRDHWAHVGTAFA